jgi:lipoate-protein ligase A
MNCVHFLMQPGIDPVRSTATDFYLRRLVARSRGSGTGVLRVHSFPGRWLSVGRYHLAPSLPGHAGVGVYRRQTGGRALPAGDGFVGVSLILPHRSALLAEHALALAPSQVLNRYVRGLMEACRIAKLRVNYPGRDLVTVDRRALAALSFDEDEDGTLHFEAVLATTSDFSIVPDLLEAVDRQGVVKAELLTAAQTTSLARELGSEACFEKTAEMIRSGYERYFGLEIVPQVLTPLEEQSVDALALREFSPQRWLDSRTRPAGLDRHVATWTQLGVFEAFFALRQERFIRDILFAGDFIANHAAIAALERKLRLCPLEWQAVNDVVNSVFESPANYLLGVGKLRVIADLLARAGAA